MSHVAPQRHEVAEGESRNASISFSKKLDTGELLSGTPAILEILTSDLTITNKLVSTTELDINDVPVPAGEAVRLSFSGQRPGVSYCIKITVSTDSSPPQVLRGNITFDTDSGDNCG